MRLWNETRLGCGYCRVPYRLARHTALPTEPLMTAKPVKVRRSRAFWLLAAMWGGVVIFVIAQNLLA